MRGDQVRRPMSMQERRKFDVIDCEVKRVLEQVDEARTMKQAQKTATSGAKKTGSGAAAAPTVAAILRKSAQGMHGQRIKSTL